MAQELAHSEHEVLSTGERIRIFRQRRKLSLRELADVTGISPSSLSAYERDAIDPSGHALRALSLALGVSTDYLLRLRATPPKLSGKRTRPARPTQPPLVRAIQGGKG